MLSVRRMRQLGVPALAVAAAGLTVLLTQTASQAVVPSKDSTPADAFSECMRTHGVPDFPGITVGPDGRVTLKSGNVPLFSDAYRSAIAACASLSPSGSTLPSQPALPTLGCPSIIKPS